MAGLIFTILSVVSTIALAAIVLLNNRKSVIHISLFIFSLGFAGAIGSNYLTSYFTEANQVLLWIRMTMFFASILTPSFYLFIKNFPERKLVVSHKEVALIVALTLFSMLLAISPWMFTNVEIVDGNIVPSQGPGIFYFFAIFLYYLVSSIILLVKKIRQTTGVQKAQLRYILAGLAISFTFILFFNVVMTLIFKNSSLITLTNIAPLIFIGTVGYAIVKHRLMDIRLIVKRTSVYVSSIVAVLLIALGLYRLEIAYFKEIIPPGTWGPIVLLAGIILFDPIKRSFERIANKYFFASLYTYQNTLEELGKKLTFTIDLSDIIDSIIKTIKNTMRLDRSGVLLYDNPSSNFKIYRTEGFTESNGISLVRNNFLTGYLIKNRMPVLYQELESLQNNGNGEKAEIAKLQTNMRRIEAHICLPLLVKDKLIGIIVLGQKVSRDAYTKEDMRLLEAVTNQASIAVENARLYDEIRQFNRTLQQKVSAQTHNIKAKNVQLEKLLKAQSEFLDIASHQLRTPVSVIRGIISMFQDGDMAKLPKEKQAEFIESASQKGAKLDQIINDILAASELDSRKFDIDAKTPKIQLEEVVDRAVKGFKLEAEQRKIDLVWQKPAASLPQIVGNAEFLEQAVSNFISNALKYTPSTEMVKEARAKRKTKGRVKVDIRKVKNDLVVSVSDDGIGIPKDEVKKLFQKFSRASNATAMYTDGSGLGLFIVREIIEGHRGKAWVESEEGKGSKFYLSLPITK